MTETAVKLLEQGIMSFLVVILLVGIGYGTFKFGSSILGMLKVFLDGLLLEFKDMIKSITDLGDAERLSREQHTLEHKEIITALGEIKDDIKQCTK